MGLSLMNMLGLSSSVWKFFLLHYTQVVCQYRLWRADHAYLMYLMLKRPLSHLNGLTTAKFKPLIFSVVFSNFLFCGSRASRRIPRKRPSSIIKEACLLFRYLARDVLLLRARGCGNVFSDPLHSNGYYFLTHGSEPFLRSCQLCSHSRIAMSIHVTKSTEWISYFDNALA
jgi:hypothetical protein